MMRLAILALAFLIAAGGAPARAYAPIATMTAASRAAPAAAFRLAASTTKPAVVKRCGSRGGFRKSRSYYGYGC